MNLRIHLRGTTGRQFRWLGFCLALIAVTFCASSGYDGDGNGMSDVYQKIHGIPSNPSIDSDGDGQNNLFESLAGTDPWDPSNSVDGRFQCLIEQNGSSVQIKWWGVKGKRYQVEATEDLLSEWSVIGDAVVGDNDWLYYTEDFPAQMSMSAAGSDESSQAQAKTDWQAELPYLDGLGPMMPYLGSDESGLDFWWQFTYNLPRSPGEAWQDFDQDGQPNIVESKANTNPWSSTSFVHATLAKLGDNLTVEWSSPQGVKYRLETPLSFSMMNGSDFFEESNPAAKTKFSLPTTVYGERLGKTGPLRFSCLEEADPWMQTSTDFIETKGFGSAMAFSAASVIPGEDSKVLLVWKNSNGATYVAELSAALSDWFRWEIPQTLLDGKTPRGAASMMTSTQSLTGDASPKKFFRVRVIPSLNPDNDVFDDWEEWVAGTDPAVANGLPAGWGFLEQYGTWDSEREGLPRNLSTFPEGGDGNGVMALAASAGDEIVTAPNVIPVLLIEQVQNYDYKNYFPEFYQSAAPLLKYYKKKVEQSSLSGGCPESAVGGTVTSIWTHENGLDVTTTGRPLYASGSVSMSSPTSRTITGPTSSYDDPPNIEYDCPGTATVNETLSMEYTTAELISTVVDGLLPWTGDYYAAEYAYVQRDLSEDETTFQLSKLRFKFQFEGENPHDLPKTLNWLVKFNPEDGSDPIWKAYTWKGTGDETPVYNIDPQTENGGKDGYYEVYVLPNYLRVNSGDPQPSPEGQILDKAALSFDAYLFHITPDLPPNQPVWFSRHMQADGNFTDWEKLAGVTGLNATHTPSLGGVYQVKAVFEMDNAEPELHYLRPQNGGADDFKCKAGQIDCFGVIDTDIQRTIALQARGNFGSTAYANAGVAYLPSYGDPSNKCNLFVAHKATDAGAIVEWINKSLKYPFNPYPPSANQWAGQQSTSRFGNSTAIPDWDLQPANARPQPGWVVAHPAGTGSGHVGIVDYDGKGMAAGAKTVNKNYNFIDGVSRFRRYSGD